MKENEINSPVPIHRYFRNKRFDSTSIWDRFSNGFLVVDDFPHSSLRFMKLWPRIAYYTIDSDVFITVRFHYKNLSTIYIYKGECPFVSLFVMHFLNIEANATNFLGSIYASDQSDCSMLWYIGDLLRAISGHIEYISPGIVKGLKFESKVLSPW